MNTSSVKVFEVRNSTYECGNGSGDTLRFQIPRSVALLNPEQTYLKFQLVVGSTGAGALGGGGEAGTTHYYPYTLNTKIGAESVIKELTLQSNGVVLEQIFGYNMTCRMINNYTHNSTIDNMTQLYKGGDTKYVSAKNILTDRVSNPAGTSTAGVAQTNKRIEVIVPLSLSGILNGSQPYPNMLAPLELQILLEDDTMKILEFQGAVLGGDAVPTEKDIQGRIAGYGDKVGTGSALAYQVDALSGAVDANNTTFCDLYTTGATKYGNGNVVNTGAITNDNMMNFPFWVGQTVVLEGEVGGNTTNFEAVVASVSQQGGKLRINFQGNLDLTGNTDPKPRVWVKQASGDATLTLSNVELVVGVITPSDKQLSALRTAVGSAGGYSFDYKSYLDFPVNNASSNLRISNLINCKLSRCKSILSYYEQVGSLLGGYEDNLTPPLDSKTNPTEYIFRINNVLVPNRRVSLSNYIRNRNQPAGWSPIHIKELEDSLESCGLPVRDLSDIDGALIISRGLSRANTSMNLMDAQGETRLEVSFSAQTRSLLFHNVVCFMKRMVLKGGSVMVME